jgi:hypothetical protein
VVDRVVIVPLIDKCEILSAFLLIEEENALAPNLQLLQLAKLRKFDHKTENLTLKTKNFKNEKNPGY